MAQHRPPSVADLMIAAAASAKRLRVLHYGTV
jgi:predicted nucleic acid-binding protein